MSYRNRVLAALAFWLGFLSFVGPALISDDSYELPIAGALLAVAGVWATYRFVILPKVKS